MLVNRLLRAQHAQRAQLVVEDPFAQGGLDDVGAVEAGARDGQGGQLGEWRGEARVRGLTSPCSWCVRQTSA